MKEKRRYQSYLEEKGLETSTIQIYMRAAKQMEAYCRTNHPKQGQVKKYVETMCLRYKPATVNLYTIALNQYFTYRRMPRLKIKTKRLCVRRSLENVISMEEYKQLLAAAQRSGKHKYYMILRVLAVTGIRIGELKYITVENVRQGYAMIYHKGRLREIYIAENVRQELISYCKFKKLENGIIFRGTSELPISRNAVWKMLKKLALLAEVPVEKVYPHSFRHMMAIHYMENYGNIAELADILGHSSIEITRIYTLTTKEEKRKRLEDMGF